MLGFVYPGQGSQITGMGSFLHSEFEVARRTFEQASEAISFDLKKLCFTGTVQELALTENTQPALLTVSIATTRVIQEITGLVPTITAGHSVGEYASLVLGQSLSLNDAMKAVQLRGQAMQNAVPAGHGGMVAVLGLTEEQVEFLCRWACDNSGFAPLAAANYNCEGQIVISGDQKVLNWLKENFKPEVLPDSPRRAKLIPLQVSAPFHCEMMLPAQDVMTTFFETIPFLDSKLPIIQNVTAKVENKAKQLKANLISQVSGSVKWTQTMQEFKSRNCSTIVECGNGVVLKGLFKKADPEFFKVFSTNSLEDLKALEGLNQPEG